MGVHLFLIFIPATVMSVVWNDIPRTFPNRSFSSSLSFPYKMNTGLTLNFISAVLYMPRTTGCYFGVQTDHICLDTSLVSLRKHKFRAIMRKAIVKNSSTMFCVSLSSQFFLFKELTKCFLKWNFFLLLLPIRDVSRFTTSLPIPFIISLKFLTFLNCAHVHVNIYLTIHIELAYRAHFFFVGRGLSLSSTIWS